MPGRLTLTLGPAELQSAFSLVHISAEYFPRYNIAPLQRIAVVENDGKGTMSFVTWGLIPSPENKVKMTNFLENARSESLLKTPSFRESFKHRRCLVLADGYYEWLKVPRKRVKLAYRVMLKSRQPFAFAGIWDSWQSMDGSEIKTCAVITCAPNELVAQIHHRMGVILRENDFEKWLRPGEADTHDLKPLLIPYPAQEMLYYPVSTIVGNARNETPECIKPIGDPVTI